MEIGHLLDKYRNSFILSGPAGSGKSFAIAEFLSFCGRRLIEWDKNEKSGAPVPPIPLLLDARLYRGSFADLASVNAPSKLTITTLSQRHEVVIIVDSIDEMSTTELDSGRWRSDLESFVTALKRYKLIFSTRRADLVPRNDLPEFKVMGLGDEIVREGLAEISKDADLLPPEFVEALKTPFLLSLSRSLLGRRDDIRNAPSLLSAFLKSNLNKIEPSLVSTRLHIQLASLAGSLINIGRETIALSETHRHLRLGTNRNLSQSQQIVDRLVGAGILVSEVDAHVRFVHRTVTEYLAAESVVASWRSGKLDLSQVLSSRRWDNSVVWATSILPDNEAERFIRDVYDVDPVLAYRIVMTAEIGATRVWSAFLDAACRKPPTDDKMHEIAYFVEQDINVPAGAAPKLKELVTAPYNVEVSWISSHLACAFADDGRTRILQRANDSSDPARNFVLGQIIPRMATITTDELSSEAANRLLELYVDGKLEPWPSPGNIATERFIIDVLLPAAKEIGSDRYRRESIEIILQEAGERHDRRYFPPWHDRSIN